jgi:hypothetical protein
VVLSVSHSESPTYQTVGGVQARRAPTRHEVIHLYAVTDISMSVGGVCLFALVIVFPIKVILFPFLFVCLILQVFGYWLDDRLRQRNLIEWPKRPGLIAFRKPRDKYIMALFLWRVLFAVGLTVAFIAYVFRLV